MGLGWWLGGEELWGDGWGVMGVGWRLWGEELWGRGDGHGGVSVGWEIQGMGCRAGVGDVG